MLEYSRKDSEDRIEIELRGRIDEHAETSLGALGRALAPGEPVIDLDCGGITGINSAGVERWARFLGPLSQERVVELSRCPVALIEYANMTELVLGNAEVKSVFFPLQCAPCQISSEILVRVADLGSDGRLEIPRCPQCGGLREREVEESSYFAFLDFYGGPG